MKRGMIRELAVAGFLLVFSLVVLFVLIPTQIEQAPEYDLPSLSSAFFPELATFIILGLTVVLIMGHLRRLSKGLPPMDDNAEPLTRGEQWRVVWAMAVSAAYYLALEHLGFWIINTAGVTALMMLQDRRRIWRQLLIAFVTTAAVYAFFHYVMKVQFPVGEIFK